jgi:hypothetical protein
MDLLKYIEALREFHRREGYYPPFGQFQREQEERERQRDSGTEQPARPLPFRKRQRPWK